MTFTYSGPLATAVFVTGAFNDAQANAKANSLASGVAFDSADSRIDLAHEWADHRYVPFLLDWTRVQAHAAQSVTLRAPAGPG